MDNKGFKGGGEKSVCLSRPKKNHPGKYKSENS